MVGIYKITNKINGKSYVGQSNNVQRRFNEHCTKAESSRIPLDAAIKKHGKDNFIFELLEECCLDDLNDREAHWIDFYNTVNLGYNCNPGGDNAQTGSSNGNSKITEQDVVLIRKSYAERKRQKDIYETHFSDKISFAHFQNVWQGRVWSHIMPEVFTKENKEYYMMKNSIGEKSSKASFTEEEVLNIRKRYVSESAKEIYLDYSDRVKYNTFQSMLWGRTYNNIPIYSKKTKQWINNQSCID